MQATRAEWVRRAIAAGNSLHFNRKVPWRHNLFNVSCGIGLWLSILAVVLWLAPSNSWLMLPVWALITSLLFYCNFILIVHECAHNMFVISPGSRRTQRWLNRIIGVLAGIPLWTDYVVHWEIGHPIHHRNPCRPGDPQDPDPLTGPRLMRELRRLLLIPGYVFTVNPSNQYGLSWIHAPAALLWVGLLVWSVSRGDQGRSFAVVFLAMQWLMVLNLLKKGSEHGGGVGEEPDAALRARSYSYLLHHFFSPLNINLHFEHHMNMCVPWYDLGRYHELLRGIVPVELHEYCWNDHQWMHVLAGARLVVPEELRELMGGRTDQEHDGEDSAGSVTQG